MLFFNQIIKWHEQQGWTALQTGQNMDGHTDK